MIEFILVLYCRVAHLAGKLIRKLKVNQPDLVESKLIDDRDELCVEIAGLCHDLGELDLSYTEP